MISKMKNRMRKLLALLIYAYTDVFWSRQATTFFASFYACYGDAHSARSRYSNNNGCSTNNDDDYHNRELVVEKEAAEQTLVGPARLFKIRDWHQGTWELPLVHDDFIKKNKWTHKQNCCCAICTQCKQKPQAILVTKKEAQVETWVVGCRLVSLNAFFMVLGVLVRARAHEDLLVLCICGYGCHSRVATSFRRDGDVFRQRSHLLKAKSDYGEHDKINQGRWYHFPQRGFKAL